MPRAAFQVLVIPYRLINGIPEYCVFQVASRDGGFWQGIAGGGEEDESFLEAAKRESHEEGDIPPDKVFLELQSKSSVPVNCFQDRQHWPADLYVVVEHAFGVDVGGMNIRLSQEHQNFQWLPYEKAETLLKFDSNKNALWELEQRLRGIKPAQM